MKSPCGVISAGGWLSSTTLLPLMLMPWPRPSLMFSVSSLARASSMPRLAAWPMAVCGASAEGAVGAVGAADGCGEGEHPTSAMASDSVANLDVRLMVFSGSGGDAVDDGKRLAF